jgi:protein O-mannosyl-transferase
MNVGRDQSAAPRFPGATGWSARLSTQIFFILALCCAFFVSALYSPSLGFQFVLDDHRYLSDPRIQESGHIWDYFANYVWAQFTGGPPSFYRPGFLLWMRINFLLSGFSPWGWHLLSIAKHLFVALLLGMLVWRLLRDSLSSLLAATLFAVHPAQTESVSWVTVPDPLMSAAILGALLFYLRYLDALSAKTRPPGRKRRKTAGTNSSQASSIWLIASAIAYFAALTAKETAIIFPAVIFALDLSPRPAASLKRGSTVSPNAWLRVKPALLHTAAFLFVTVVYLLLRLHALQGKLAPATQQLSWKTILLSWPATLWFYAKVLLWPVRSYSFADPPLAQTLSVRGVLLPLLGLTALAVILSGTLFWACRQARAQRPEMETVGVMRALMIGTLLVLLPFLLTLNLNALNPGDFLHGRYAYLPLAGLMLLAATAWHLVQNHKMILLGAAGALTILFAGLTFAQQKQWKDDATVFTIAHQLAPHNDKVSINLADTHVQAAIHWSEEGRCSDAVPVFQHL